MTPEEIDKRIADAGLSDVAEVFTSTIEIDPHVPHPNGGYWDGYTFLAALLTAERAADASTTKTSMDALYVLAHVQPAVHEALTRYQRGDITLEQALIRMVFTLSEQLENAKAAIMDCLARANQPVIIQSNVNPVNASTTTPGVWVVVTDDYDDGTPLTDKWIEVDGDIIVRAPSNFPLDTDRGRQELANLTFIARAHNHGTR